MRAAGESSGQRAGGGGGGNGPKGSSVGGAGRGGQIMDKGRELYLKVCVKGEWRTADDKIGGPASRFGYPMYEEDREKVWWEIGVSGARQLVYRGSGGMTGCSKDDRW